MRRVLAYTICAVAVVIPSLRAADKYPGTHGGDIEITPLLHASVQLEHAGVVIQVDPWSVADLSRAKPADLILISDDPAHHLDLAAIKRLRKPSAPVIVSTNVKERFPDGMVLANGASTTAAGIRVEAIAAYDLTPGEPVHPKGEANGYLVTFGGRRILFAGVTECVPELRAIKDIDVAFVPMNIPPRRMSPEAAAECVKALKPKVVYVYHYDQGTPAELTKAKPPANWLAPGTTVAQTLQAFRAALKGQSVEVRLPDWYAGVGH
jgi:L-ascorbate metabolism protein UlaG (beta-lactamase superfamily)